MDRPAMRSEEEFLGAIDGAFPYGDRARAHALIEEACSISSNAAFMVAHELARLPKDVVVEDQWRLGLLERLRERLEHPLKAPILDVAARMVRGDALAFGECRALMGRIADFPGEFNALAVVCCACEDDDAEAADGIYDDVVAGWRRSDMA